MSSLRSLGCLTSRYGARQVIRPTALTTDVRTSIIMRRSYATAPPAGNSSSGSNPLLWIGCISLGAAYTYYQKKRAEQIDQAVHKDQLENTANASVSASKTEEKKEDSKPKSETELKDNKDTKKEPITKSDDPKKTT